MANHPSELRCPLAERLPCDGSRPGGVLHGLMRLAFGASERRVGLGRGEDGEVLGVGVLGAGVIN